MEFEPPDYRASLSRFVDGYRGEAQRAIAATGMVFDFYARLFGDARIGRSHRALVNAVLSYFVVPEDLLPEAELGPWGLLDDLYLSAHVYRMLDRELPREILREAWRGDDDLHQTMDTIYKETRAALGKQTKDVLRLAGLN